MGSKVSSGFSKKLGPKRAKVQTGSYCDDDEALTLLDMVKSFKRPTQQQQQRPAKLAGREDKDKTIPTKAARPGSEDTAGGQDASSDEELIRGWQSKRKRKSKDLNDILKHEPPSSRLMLNRHDGRSQPRKQPSEEKDHAPRRDGTSTVKPAFLQLTPSKQSEGVHDNLETLAGLRVCNKTDEMKETMDTPSSSSCSLEHCKPFADVEMARRDGSGASVAEFLSVSGSGLHTCEDAKKCQNACIAKAVAPNLDRMSDEELVYWYEEVTGEKFLRRNGEKVRGRLRRIIRAEAKRAAAVNSNLLVSLPGRLDSSCLPSLTPKPRTPSPLSLVIDLNLLNSHVCEFPASIEDKEETLCAFNAESAFDESVEERIARSAPDCCKLSAGEIFVKERELEEGIARSAPDCCELSEGEVFVEERELEEKTARSVPHFSQLSEGEIPVKELELDHGFGNEVILVQECEQPERATTKDEPAVAVGISEEKSATSDVVSDEALEMGPSADLESGCHASPSHQRGITGEHVDELINDVPVESREKQTFLFSADSACRDTVLLGDAACHLPADQMDRNYSGTIVGAVSSRETEEDEALSCHVGVDSIQHSSASVLSFSPTEQSQPMLGNQDSTTPAILEECKAGEGFIPVGFKAGEGVIPEECKAGNDVIPEECKAGDDVIPEECKAGNGVIPEECKAGDCVIPEECKAGDAVIPEECKAGNGVIPEECKAGDAVIPEECRAGDGVIRSTDEDGSTKEEPGSCLIFLAREDALCATDFRESSRACEEVSVELQHGVLFEVSAVGTSAAPDNSADEDSLGALETVEEVAGPSSNANDMFGAVISSSACLATEHGPKRSNSVGEDANLFEFRAANHDSNGPRTPESSIDCANDLQLIARNQDLQERNEESIEKVPMNLETGQQVEVCSISESQHSVVCPNEVELVENNGEIGHEEISDQDWSEQAIVCLDQLYKAGTVAEAWEMSLEDKCQQPGSTSEVADRSHNLTPDQSVEGMDQTVDMCFVAEVSQPHDEAGSPAFHPLTVTSEALGGEFGACDSESDLGFQTSLASDDIDDRVLSLEEYVAGHRVEETVPQELAEGVTLHDLEEDAATQQMEDEGASYQVEEDVSEHKWIEVFDAQKVLEDAATQQMEDEGASYQVQEDGSEHKVGEIFDAQKVLEDAATQQMEDEGESYQVQEDGSEHKLGEIFDAPKLLEDAVRQRQSQGDVSQRAQACGRDTQVEEIFGPREIEQVQDSEEGAAAQEMEVEDASQEIPAEGTTCEFDKEFSSQQMVEDAVSQIVRGMVQYVAANQLEADLAPIKHVTAEDVEDDTVQSVEESASLHILDDITHGLDNDVSMQDREQEVTAQQTVEFAESQKALEGSTVQQTNEFGATVEGDGDRQKVGVEKDITGQEVEEEDASGKCSADATTHLFDVGFSAQDVVRDVASQQMHGKAPLQVTQGDGAEKEVNGDIFPSHLEQDASLQLGGNTCAEQKGDGDAPRKIQEDGAAREKDEEFAAQQLEENDFTFQQTQGEVALPRSSEHGGENEAELIRAPLQGTVLDVPHSTEGVAARQTAEDAALQQLDGIAANRRTAQFSESSLANSGPSEHRLEDASLRRVEDSAAAFKAEGDVAVHKIEEDAGAQGVEEFAALQETPGLVEQELTVRQAIGSCDPARVGSGQIQTGKSSPHSNGLSIKSSAVAPSPAVNVALIDELDVIRAGSPSPTSSLADHAKGGAKDNNLPEKALEDSADYPPTLSQPQKYSSQEGSYQAIMNEFPRTSRTAPFGPRRITRASLKASNLCCDNDREDAADYPLMLSQPQKCGSQEESSKDVMTSSLVSRRITRASLKLEKSIRTVEEFNLPSTTKLPPPQAQGVESVPVESLYNCASDWHLPADPKGGNGTCYTNQQSPPAAVGSSPMTESDFDQMDNFKYTMLQEEWQDAGKFLEQMEMPFFDVDVAEYSPKKRKSCGSEDDSDRTKRVAVEDLLHQTVTLRQGQEASYETEGSSQDDEHVPTALSKALIESNGERRGPMDNVSSWADRVNSPVGQQSSAKKRLDRLIAREQWTAPSQQLLHSVNFYEHDPSSCCLPGSFDPLLDGQQAHADCHEPKANSNCHPAMAGEPDACIDLLASERLGEEESTEEVERPSKLPRSRKTISPLSQMELMRASGSNSQSSKESPPKKIPPFRLKLPVGHARHHGGLSQFANKSSDGCSSCLDSSNMICKHADSSGFIVSLDSSDEDTYSCGSQGLDSRSNREEPERKFSLALSPVSSSPQSASIDPNENISSQQAGHSQIVSALSSKGILKNSPLSCRGLCKCAKCTESRSKTGQAADFIASQMKAFRSIALRLTREVQGLRSLVEFHLPLAGENNEIQVALKKSRDVEEAADKDLVQILRDSRRIYKLTTTKSSSPRRIVFADEAGKKLCHVKTFQSRSLPGSLLDAL